MKRGFMNIINEFHKYNITWTHVLDSIYYITRDICLKLKNHVFVDSIIYLKKRTFFTFILSKHDVVTPITSYNYYDVIDIMMFCNFNVTVKRLICMFIAGGKYDIYCMTVLHGQWPILYKYINILPCFQYSPWNAET